MGTNSSLNTSLNPCPNPTTIRASIRASIRIDMKKTLIIDHYDSFTHLLAQYFGELGGNPVVWQHDQTSLKAIQKLKPSHIVLSPGPGTVENPSDFAIGFEVLEAFYKTLPILGVCLGHQAIWKFFGGEITRAPKVMHGKRSTIHHLNEGILDGLPENFEAMRYHSLIIKIPNHKPQIITAVAGSRKGGTDNFQITNPKFKTLSDILITAWLDDGLPMAIQHRSYPVFGVQFHPESIGTPWGKHILENFLAY